MATRRALERHLPPPLARLVLECAFSPFHVAPPRLHEMRQAARLGYWEGLTCLRPSTTQFFLNQALVGACIGGHRALGVALLAWGANNLNDGLFFALQRPDSNMAQDLRAAGASHWADGTYCSCQCVQRVYRFARLPLINCCPTCVIPVGRENVS